MRKKWKCLRELWRATKRAGNASNSTENQVAVPRTLMITSMPRSDHFLSMPSAWPSVLSGRTPLPYSSWLKGMLIHRNSSVWSTDRILWFNKSVCHVSDVALCCYLRVTGSSTTWNRTNWTYLLVQDSGPTSTILATRRYTSLSVAVQNYYGYHCT